MDGERPELWVTCRLGGMDLRCTSLTVALHAETNLREKAARPNLQIRRDRPGRKLPPPDITNAHAPEKFGTQLLARSPSACEYVLTTGTLIAEVIDDRETILRLLHSAPGSVVCGADDRIPELA